METEDASAEIKEGLAIINPHTNSGASASAATSVKIALFQINQVYDGGGVFLSKIYLISGITSQARDFQLDIDSSLYLTAVFMK